MIVTQENAATVSAIFLKLADERFVMRSVSAIKRGTDLTTAQVLDTAAQIGCPLRRRAADDRLYIQRPVRVAEAQDIVNKAQAVLAGSAEPFALDFLPEQVDLMGEIEANLIEGSQE
jgi:hypothetical protein